MATVKSKSGQKRRGKKKSADSGLKSFFKAHSLAITIAGAIFAALVIGASIIALPSYHGSEVMIYIPRSATEASVKDSLRAKLGNTLGNRVFMLWQFQGGRPSVSHGAYRVEDGMSAGKLSHRLATGAQSPLKVTFNGTRTMDRLADQVTGPLEMTSRQFLNACKSVLVDSGFSEPEFPAAFVPDTYEFYWTIDPDALVGKLLDYRNRFWTDSRKKQATDMGLTPVQVATLASIVEEETAKSDERPKVARLYLNRLGRDMKLQADPTVKFAVGDFSIRRVLHQHLAVESPYNTYKNNGLPPGPIRVVEKASIDAVLNAPNHDFIYMCAKEDFSGYHNFASDYATHEANARKYQNELNKRGIK